MYTFDDLVAARLIHRQHPELQGVLSSGLDRLADYEGRRGFRTLLGDLLKAEAISRETAERTWEAVEKYKRGRALGLYTLLLTQEGGLQRALIEATTRSLGDAADCFRLGEALVKAGHLDVELEPRLRFKAKLAFDQDQAGQLDAYRGRRRAEGAQTLVGGGIEEETGEEKIPSGIYKMQMVIPDEAEATGIFDRAALKLRPLETLAPRFPIPDWVDTAAERVGQLVGDYRILGKVGAGAMATVYLADHPERSSPVALKLLPPDASHERKARFKREILANGFFSHENAIDVYDAGVTDDGTHFLAMEFFDGSDLDNILESEGTISLRQSLTIVRQILQALETAHDAGIVHRDIKPSNILVSTGAGQAKLMDFGIALIKDLGDFKAKVFESDDGGVTGTPEYLSPEQAFRDPVGPPSDLYSLGMTLYRMLAGRLPFSSETVSGWISNHMVEEPLPLGKAAPEGDWPPRLVALFGRLFVKKPTERIQTAGEVLAEIDALALELGSGRRSRLFDKFRRGF